VTYELTETGLGQALRRISDGAIIPTDPENVDYQAFLSWVEEGNNPTLAEPAPDPPSPLGDWGAFLELVIGAPVYQTIYAQAAQSLPVNTAFTAISGALVLGAGGRPNLAGLQSGVDQLLQAATLTAEDLDQLRDIAEQTGVPLQISTPTPQ